MRVEEILDRISEWTAIDDFSRMVAAHFGDPRTVLEVESYRLGKGRTTFKKFRDEVVPAYHFIMATGTSGSIRFALSDSMPDCWIRHEGRPTPQGIEITRANVKEQVWRARYLNQHGCGPCFLGLSDDDPDAMYASKIQEDPRGYSTNEALEARLAGILRCIERKNAPSEARNYSGCELLVEGFINDEQLPLPYWDRILPRLHEATAHSIFERVHLIGCSSSKFYRCLK
ncbi:MAG: hypothetical protein K0M49_11365 [Arenimonas sp.]|nr:hypothetical protein [Rhizobium sp.]MBW8446219.1 hypothetical protein [Arenimonas sp.]